MKMRFLGCTSGKPFRKQNDDLPSAGIRFRRHCANYCFGVELHSGRQVRRFGHFSGRSCRGLPATCRLTLADRCVVSGHFEVLILSCVYHDVHKTTVGTSKVPPTCSSRHPVWGSKKWRNIRTCRPKCVWWMNVILAIQAKTTTLSVKWCCGVFSERSLETVSFMLVLAFFDGFGACLRVRPKHGPTLFTVFR